ncbi:hypothetical protein ABZ916_31535 [Streptomyces sp. NPDC046853]|uniref:hypothetical protein n=1 Tax=Streptomyces sp. NPDC046853 TaxID=3154920 RepID=UPI0033E1DF5D
MARRPAWPRPRGAADREQRLRSRFALGREPADGDPAAYYQGGAAGYADYPAAG